MEDLHVIPGCPWYQQFEKYGAPNINWCEASVCSFFNNPANTWSNLGFIFLSLLVFWQAKKLKCTSRYYYGSLVFWVGLTSLIYHATNNFLTQYFDFVGMFSLLSYLAYINFKRLSRKRAAIEGFLVFVVQNSMFYTFTKISFPTQYIVFFIIVFLIILEIKTAKVGKITGNYQTHKKTSPEYKMFLLTILTFAFGETLSLLDLKKVFCDPDNHFIQGHALWHLCGALGLYFYYRFLKQFNFFKN